MSTHELGTLLLTLFCLLSTAHLFGYVFVRLRQPRVIGEILAGVLFGPSILGRFGLSLMHLGMAPASAVKVDAAIGFLYHLGMLLLMFLAGAESHGLFADRDGSSVAWIMGVGTALPFVLVLLTSGWLPVNEITGPASSVMAVLLVLGIAAVVTSIPVISRIFHDLRITHTRFARLVLGVAVIEDTLLWVVLAVATALARSGAFPHVAIASHVGVTILYFALGLLVGPPALRRLNAAPWNCFLGFSPLAYMMTILLAYSAIAAMLDVNLVFAAFLAGLAVNGDRRRFHDSVVAVAAFSFGVFIPLYFALVGFRLDFKKDLSLPMLSVFLLGSCLLKVTGVAAGAFLAGFRGRALANLAIATNARGGPGIIVASVALDAGIINPRFYTTLIITAILTSQAAGAWLEFVLRRRWPLLCPQDAPVLAVSMEEGQVPSEAQVQ